MIRYFFNKTNAQFIQLCGEHLSDRPFSPDWVEIEKAAFDHLLLVDSNPALIPDLAENLEDCLHYVDRWRNTHLGEGDITAMNARHALALAKPDDEGRRAKGWNS